MTPLLIYFVKANLVIGILFTAYYLLLRKEKFFGLNRTILLGIIALAFVLPLLPAVKGSAKSGLQHDLSAVSPFFGMERSRENRGGAAFIKPPEQAATPQPVHDTISGFTLFNLFEATYIIVATILILRLLFQLLRVYNVIKKSRREKSDGIVYCYHQLDLPPFSFFHYLVLNKDQYPPAELGQVIAHEQVHIHQGHSFDLLLVEFLHALCWGNPLLIGLKRAMKLNLEFIADEKVVSTGIDIRAYQYSILRCLRQPGMPLVNEYASSKIKLRIQMINKKRSPLRNLYKYALTLPLLAGAYFIVNPLQAKATVLRDVQTPKTGWQDLKAFEGYYQSDFNKDGYIRIRATGGQLILKQMWDDQEVSFKQISALEFSGNDGKFPLKFSKDASGAIVQVLAFNRDHWNKVKDYKEITFITLQPAQLKTFEGFYQMEVQQGKMDYLQIESTGEGLVLRQGWDGLEIQFRPISGTEFFNKKASFPLEFTRNSAGAVIGLIAFRRDHWEKMTDPSKAVMKKQVKLEVPQLKKLEGAYHMKGGNGQDITIILHARDGGIVLKQSWDNREVPLVPASPTEFFSKDFSFPVVFTVDNNGVATELVAFDRDRWEKVK